MDPIPVSDKAIADYVAEFRMDRFLNPALLAELRLFRFPAYKTIFLEQEKIPYLYFQVEGQVRCAHYHSNGTLAVVALTEAFNVLGDVEILKNDRTSTAVVTTRDSVLLGLPVPAAQKYGFDDPKFLRYIISQLTEKLNYSTSLRLGHLLPVKSRFAMYLLVSGEAAADKVMILPEKEMLASMLGTSPRHLNRVLRELVEEGAIGTGYPGVRIKDLSILNHLIS